MKQALTTSLLACAILALFAIPGRAETHHRIGVGAHYWMVIDDIDIDDVDDNGLAWILSYQLQPAPLIKLEAAIEALPEGFGGADDTVYAPQAYAIIGAGLYAALGVGVYYADGEFTDARFFAVRAGLDLELLPTFFLDLNANYRFNQWEDLSDVADDIDSDTVTLGAAARIEF